MDTTDVNNFAAYLRSLSHHGRSLFYHRAGTSSNYFYKLRHGLRHASPDLIVSLSLATEGRCLPSDVAAFFENLKWSRDTDRLLSMLREDWVDDFTFARCVGEYDLHERMSELTEDGHEITIRLDDNRRQYRINE